MIVYTIEQRWEILRQIALQKMPILAKKKNQLFRWSSLGSWRRRKQAKFSHLGHRIPARIHWKANAPKTSHCLMRILVRKHNWTTFLRKWERRGHYSQLRSLSGHVDPSFVHKNWRGEYWQHLVSTERRYMPQSRSYTRCFAPCCWRSHYQQQILWHFATSELQFDTVGLLFAGCRQR